MASSIEINTMDNYNMSSIDTLDQHLPNAESIDAMTKSYA